jgi:CheY-like chemotaxis protein
VIALLWGKIFSSPTRKISVLIVDDEEDIRMIVRGLLEGDRFGPIWEAADGEEALDAAYRYQPDLIVLDYMIPKLDGESVAKGLRILAPKAKVLVLSGILKSTPEWADGFLAKEDVARLRHVLDTAFGPRGGW